MTEQAASLRPAFANQLRPSSSLSSTSSTTTAAGGGAGDSGGAGGAQSKRPSNSRFKQQQLPAWQPVLTARTVLPLLFVIGFAFVPVGIGLLMFSAGVQQVTLDYTHCNKSGDSVSCDQHMSSSPGDVCQCRLEFELTEAMQAPVYIYYGLTNFYQNHRRYVKSRDDAQLAGATGGAALADCAPFDFAPDGTAYAPCGAIANSMFNDSFSLVLNPDDTVDVPLLDTGIAWPSDKMYKFKNPPGALDHSAAFANTTQPPNWPKPVWKLDPDNADNNGYRNERLIVWMRTAALPTFRKLWARVEHRDQFENGLPAGRYALTVHYNYPVTGFGGTKRFIVTNTSPLGGKNSFLGGAYITVGCLCLLVGVAFLVIHVKFGRDTSRLITNHTPWS